MLKNFRAGQLVRAASLALLATTASVAVIATMTTPAAAQVSAGDLAAISSAMANAINAAKAGLPPGSSQAQIDAAVSAAIAATTRVSDFDL